MRLNYSAHLSVYLCMCNVFAEISDSDPQNDLETLPKSIRAHKPGLVVFSIIGRDAIARARRRRLRGLRAGRIARVLLPRLPWSAGQQEQRVSTGNENRDDRFASRLRGSAPSASGSSDRVVEEVEGGLIVLGVVGHGRAPLRGLLSSERRQDHSRVPRAGL